jgi:transcriptional regulator with XRE-family HTH domain
VSERSQFEELRRARVAAGLTQREAASRLGLSQPYLSQMECGRRVVPNRVLKRMKRLYGLRATSLPLPGKPGEGVANADKHPSRLAALGYPGYAHVLPSPELNPAVVVLEALSEEDLDARVTCALPWVLVEYPDLNWNWLLTHVKLRNLQNRLGFLVSLARELAERTGNKPDAARRLSEVERELEQARLVAETTLSRESMPAAEREWLRANRPALARRWNVVTSLNAEEMPSVA